MRVLDLFAGIGGFTVGLEQAGFETVAFCEINPYAQKVLAKNWPGVPIYDDVRQITADRLVSDGIGVDVITGGFPCQDISLAGNLAGIEGERSGLWSECARLIGELRPRYAIFENVTNLLNGDGGDWFKRVLWDISAVGYDAEWHCIPASELGAHHHRDRVWIVAYPAGARSETRSSDRLGDDDRSRGDKRQSSSAGQSTSVLLENTRHGCGRHTESFARGEDSQGKRERDSSATGRPSENVADPIIQGSQGRLYRWPNTKRQSESGHPGCRSATFRQSRENPWDVEPNVGRVANGVPSRSHRLKCLGNAVVPQIPLFIGEQIMLNNSKEQSADRCTSQDAQIDPLGLSELPQS